MHMTYVLNSEARPGGSPISTKPARKRLVSIAAGPLLAVLPFFVLPGSLAIEARAVAATAILMAIWWMTEAFPIPAVSLLPVVLFPMLGVAPVNAAAAPYANPIIFLILGGVLLGLAVQRWNLHHRIALLTILAFGTKPSQIVLGLMVAAGFISAWVSNTATAVIMVPIGLSVITLVKSPRRVSSSSRHQFSLASPIASRSDASAHLSANQSIRYWPHTYRTHSGLRLASDKGCYLVCLSQRYLSPLPG